MKFFSYICSCVALDTGMCGFHFFFFLVNLSSKVTKFAVV